MNILKREDPQTIANILNGEQTLLVMKKAPKNSEGCWWYLYCSRGNKELYKWSEKVGYFADNHCKKLHHQPCTPKALNDKVVARFWCDEVVERPAEELDPYRMENEGDDEIEGTCLSSNQICGYVGHGFGEDGIMVYYIHISKLEIFNEPKELSEFGKPITYYENISSCPNLYDLYVGKKAALRIKKAPINYCYVEGE